MSTTSAVTSGLLLTEVVVTPTGGEFVEILNPTDSAIDLSDVYLTDATFASGGTFYYNLPTGSNAGGGGFADFFARFPDGASIGAHAYVTVAMAGSADFVSAYGTAPDFELFDDGSDDGEAVMREALPGSINGQGGLTNAGEFLVLSEWDGASDIVIDHDYVVWGDKNEAVDKTGVAIDGPDADMAPTAYEPDTAIADQEVIAAGAHGSGNAFTRVDLSEGTEVQTGGNGVDGADETSENLSETWTTSLPASPGEGAPEPVAGSGELEIAVAAEFTGEGGEGASEVVARENNVLYVTNGEQDRIDIFPLDGSAPGSIDLSTLPGYAGIQSVDVANGVVAVAIERDAVDVAGVQTAQPGFVALFDTAGNLLSTVDVGNLPDDVTFTPDGNTLLVAGEGENNVDSDHGADPLGSVAVVDVTDPALPSSSLLFFTAFNGEEDQLRADGVRIREGVPFAFDAEPEFVTVSPDGSTAYVTLQENNAVAVLDLASDTFTDILPLGTVDYAQGDNALDPNDDGVVDIASFDDLVGIRMPDAAAAFTVNGTTYFATANEGDGRGDVGDGAEADEARVQDILDGDVPGLTIDPSVDTAGLERLTVSTVDGDEGDDGDIDVLHAFGTRSFTIFDETGNLVFDSGPEFEQIIASNAPERFNDDDGDTDGDEDRSDNKGPEPEAIAVGEVGEELYAFIGLERDSGIMIYNVTDPENAVFVDYIVPAFVDTTPTGEVARHGPEVIAFTPAGETLSGNAEIAVSYEISGTTIVYEVAPLPTIPEIQGAGHISPFDGEEVRTRGIVTAVDFNGYYLEDPEGDGDPATSDGIFVFTGSGGTAGLAVGDEVEVAGTVSEFIPGGAGTGNLSITQIVETSTTVLSSGNALPEAERIADGGRLPPDGAVISDDELPVNLQDVPGTFDPDEDAIDFFESIEGMRVTVEAPQAVQPLNRFDEFNVLASGGAGSSTPFNDRGGINIDPGLDGDGDLNPERIQIAYDSFFDLVDEDAVPSEITVGDRMTDITGVVSYSFGNFEVLVTEPFDVATPSAIAPQTTTLSGGADFVTVATYNVLNVTANTQGVQGSAQADPEADDDAAQIEAIAQQIVANLGAPDILALQEIQDDSGEDDDGTLGAEDTLQALVDAIVAAGGPQYAFASALVDENNENGGAPNANIRNAFLWNPQRVTNEEIVTLESAELASFTVTDTEAWNDFDSRDPLLGTFTFNGETITLVNNHFESRSGSDPIFGGPQPFEQGGEEGRERQAAALNEVVDGILEQDPSARVVVLGDFNTFEQTDDLSQILPGTGDERVLNNLIEQVPEGERYTFNFEGNSQVLDHIFVTDNLLPGAEADVVHLNVDVSDPTSDHEPVLARLRIEGPADGDLVGTAGDDEIEGTDDPLVISGLAGDDTVTGGSDDDVIGGGLDDDTVDGGGGNDRLFGGEGDDDVSGGEGDDVARGKGGDDTVSGGAGNDSLVGDGGDDMLFAGDGDDYVDAGEGNDEIDPGAGDDRVRGEVGNDTVLASSGDDVLLGLDGDDLLFGGEGNDLVVGGAGSDTVTGGLGEDSVRGGADQDFFVLSLGEGFDRIADFMSAEDLFVLPETVSFADLEITDDAISLGDDLLARINGAGADLTEADFVPATDIFV